MNGRCPMTLKQLFKAAKRHLLYRALPHGLVSWRYLLLNQPAQVRLHRQLWLMGRDQRLPISLYLFMELFLWLRWQLFTAWRRSWQVVKRCGTEIALKEGIGTATLLVRLLSTSLCHCIPPGEVITFGLYRRDTRQHLWDYVFTHEAGAFHRWRNSRTNDSAGALRLVQDKHALDNLLSTHGIPMVPILAVIPRGATADLTLPLQSYPRLFCKPRHGSASRDNFVVEQSVKHESPVIFDVVSGVKTKPTNVNALSKAMACDDFLIQPLMENHPLFAALVPSGDAITLRIITEPSDTGTRCYSATLEIPHLEDNGCPYHTILSIEISSGMILPFPNDSLSANTRKRHDTVHDKLKNVTVPFWDEIRSSAMSAHRLLPELYAIAWDYVITPDGHYMLEGNSGWGTATPQLLIGGLLYRHAQER